MMQGPDVAVRTAEGRDLPVLADLYRRCAAEIAQERGGQHVVASGAFSEPLDEKLASSMARAGDLLAAGTIDGVVTGVGAAHLAYLADGTPYAVIDVLYVEPGARSIGVGEALLEHIVLWSAAHGCEGLDAPALPGMRESKNFFEAAGLVARLLVMHRRLTPTDALQMAGGMTSSEPAPSTPECCVGAVVVEDDHLLLIQRGTPPGAGKWSLPGGRVDPGETLATAVAREVREETGLEVAPGPFIGQVERLGPGYHFVILDFRAELADRTASGGLPNPAAASDAAAAAWVPLGELSRLTLVDGLRDFLRDHAVIDD